MSTLSQLLQEKARLEAEIQRKRSKEIETAIGQCKELIAEFALTPDQLFNKGRKSKSFGYEVESSRKPVEAKYRNPETGDTWTGRGKAPLWIKDKNREEFLIQ